MFHIYTDGACRNNQDAQKRTAAWAFIVFDQNMQRKGSKSAFLGNATNNEAERLLRNYKRKQAQAVTFRSFESIDYLCQCMSMLVLMRREEPANIFDRVSRIFG